VIRFLELESRGLAVAAFSERADGDCRHLPGGDTAAGRARVCAALGIDPASLVFGKQVHGVGVASVTASERGRGGTNPADAFPDTDALVTDVPGLPLAILVADCVPLWLYEPRKRVVALVHAGRAGTFARVALHALEVMVTVHDCEPGLMHALIGPSAGPVQYEVSAAMAEEWRASGLPASGRMLDLWGANRLQLETAGVPTEHVHMSGHCTLSGDRFFSHRRDADGSRSLAVAML
jgi:polyphenol oxidase